MRTSAADSQRLRHAMLAAAVILTALTTCDAAVAFEKLTDMDYVGNTYYTIKNLTLYECQGWCREEPECQAAAFSFVTNPLTPVQETICKLQNETSGNNPSAKPTPAVSTYYMIKLRIRSNNICNRPWTFERLPRTMLQGLDNALMFTSSREDCLAACLNEKRFVCRSAEYSYITLKCHLSEHDRRSVDEIIQLVDADQVDYFENLCLTGKEACRGDREFPTPSLDIPSAVINRYVDTQYYVDLELMANNVAACQRACEIENEIMCRSFLYRGPPTGTTYNCQLFHLDHVSLPDGALTYLSADRPLIDTGREPGVYYENVCKKPLAGSASEVKLSTSAEDTQSSQFGVETSILGSGTDSSDHNLVAKSPPSAAEVAAAVAPDSEGTGQGQPLPPTPSPTASRPDTSNVGPVTGDPADGGSGGNEGLQIVTIPDTPSGGAGTDGSSGSDSGSGTPSGGGDSVGGHGSDQTDGQGNNVNCDSTGTCYDVSVLCKDTRIVVQIGTSRPFNGRVYALGRSETCNVAVVKSNQFRLDLSLSGQDCNTQSMGTVYSNTVVVQHHSVVMTKTDKIYKVRCTYDMSSRNITFGMLPISQAAQDPSSEFYDPNFDAESMGQLMIRDPDMISITSAPAAPPPTIAILNSSGEEVETVRIGDKLTFRIRIPPNTPYGIFARNCVAMAKDAKSTFKIIDNNGCPVDPNIFPRFTSEINVLQSTYEAFRFTESYGVIFQCNVKYCLGQCEAAKCDFNGKTFESWGRRRRSLRHNEPMQTTAQLLAEDPRDPESMTLSQEILVLDFGDEELPRPVERRRSSLPEVEQPPYVTKSAADFDAAADDHFTYEDQTVAMLGNCPTKTSMLALSVTCALLVLIYVCSIFYLFMKRWMTRNNKVL